MKQISEHFAFKGKPTYLYFLIFLILTETIINNDDICLFNKLICFL